MASEALTWLVLDLVDATVTRESADICLPCET